MHGTEGVGKTETSLYGIKGRRGGEGRGEGGGRLRYTGKRGGGGGGRATERLRYVG